MPHLTSLTSETYGMTPERRLIRAIMTAPIIPDPNPNPEPAPIIPDPNPNREPAPIIPDPAVPGPATPESPEPQPMPEVPPPPAMFRRALPHRRVRPARYPSGPRHLHAV